MDFVDLEGFTIFCLFSIFWLFSKNIFFPSILDNLVDWKITEHFLVVRLRLCQSYLNKSQKKNMIENNFSSSLFDHNLSPKRPQPLVSLFSSLNSSFP